MEYEVNVIKDSEADVWVASCDKLSLTLESGSFDRLIEKVRNAALEMAELKHLDIPAKLRFHLDCLEKISYGGV